MYMNNCNVYVKSEGKEKRKTWREREKHTIPDIRVLDLLQDFRPDCRVALFILIDAFGLEVEPLADAAWALVC